MSFGNVFNQEDDLLNEINMTPLVDVMLVLLIIFMLTVPILTHSIKLDLPRAQSQPGSTIPHAITLSIAANGATYWNEKIVTQAELQQRLKQSAMQQPMSSINIRADRKVAYAYVIQVMASAQNAGMTKLEFVVDPK